MSERVQLKDWKEYQECALRTQKFKEKIYLPTLVVYPADPERVSVAAMGLAGEMGEVARILNRYIDKGNFFDATKVRDELGDVAYYVAEMASACGLNLLCKRFNAETTGQVASRSFIAVTCNNLTAAIGELVDFLKKYVGHNKPFDQQLVHARLNEVLRSLTDLCVLCGFNLKSITEYNIEKLAKRHGQSYREEFYTDAV